MAHDGPQPETHTLRLHVVLFRFNKFAQASLTPPAVASKRLHAFDAVTITRVQKYTVAMAAATVLMLSGCSMSVQNVIQV